ncbi:MAG: DUF397 domain-containing protein [Pseudonocardiaceae bacterium]|nr:DUF397 domain-containing protein [Pseudonocardiaceae bacterium]
MTRLPSWSSQRYRSSSPSSAYSLIVNSRPGGSGRAVTLSSSLASGPVWHGPSRRRGTRRRGRIARCVGDTGRHSSSSARRTSATNWPSGSFTRGVDTRHHRAGPGRSADPALTVGLRPVLSEQPPDGPVLAVARAAWRDFLATVTH